MQRIPIVGCPWSGLKTELENAKKDDFSWREGRMALYFYYLNEEVKQIQQQAYCAYWTENAMGQRAFPSMKKLETEVMEMGLSLLRAPDSAVATFTSGGSESIFLALKTARDWARDTKSIDKPNIVIPRSAHPAFNRAAHFLDLDVIRVPTTRSDYRVDPTELEKRFDANTIMTLASAPNYPFGVFDPVREIGALAIKHNLWMHVDACLGGFLAPFVSKLGYHIPDFDFSVPGVTSMSADLHKYGYAPKGASLMLLRDAKLQQYQTFDFNDWERGPYISNVTQGTRSGGAAAAAWTVMNFLGERGYVHWARVLMDTVKKLTDGIDAIPGLAVLKPHELCLFVYHSIDPDVDIGAIAEAMIARGWFVGRQAEPNAIHMHLNPVHAETADQYLLALADAVREVRELNTRATNVASFTY